MLVINHKHNKFEYYKWGPHFFLFRSLKTYVWTLRYARVHHIGEECLKNYWDTHVPSSAVFGLSLTSEDATRFPWRPTVFNLKNGGLGGLKGFVPWWSWSYWSLGYRDVEVGLRISVVVGVGWLVAIDGSTLEALGVVWAAMLTSGSGKSMLMNMMSWGMLITLKESGWRKKIALDWKDVLSGWTDRTSWAKPIESILGRIVTFGWLICIQSNIICLDTPGALGSSRQVIARNSRQEKI